jgi:DNA-binding transcriptional LysR family regulator
MDRFAAMRAFICVAELQGFGAAARRLGLSPPAVTRAVAALEARLGTRLLHRTTRRVRLTDAGERYMTDARRILGEVEEAETEAAGAQAEPRGPLAVTASVMFGRRFVAPVLLAFLERYPQVEGRLVLLDRVTDLIEEGLDVAVRIASLPDSTLSAVRVGEVRRIVCASPAYLKAKGTPRQPADLARHDGIAFAPMSVGDPWSFSVGSRRRSAAPRALLQVNDTEVAIAAALAGRGVTRLLSYQVAREIKTGRLKIILEDFEPPPIPIHLVHLEGRRANARVRTFVDFAARRLRTALA